jgi:hypothetical protein
MNGHTATTRLLRVLTAILLLCGFGGAVLAGQDGVATTNLVAKTVTNHITVTMPNIHFVNEVHTNLVDQFVTNQISVHATNWTTRTVTNILAVEAFATNHLTRTITNKVTVDAYTTNLVTRTLTNQVMIAAYATNWVNRSVTNRIPVEAFQTNFVEAYRTNLKTLTLTNWETVLVMKTNWISQPVTNVVQIDMIASRAGTPEPVAAKEPAKEPAEPASNLPSSDKLILQASKSARAISNNLVGVHLNVRHSSDPAARLQIQQWRVEREDGTILCFGQDREFKRDLPVGRYKVELKLQRDASGTTPVVRGTLSVSAEEATIQQRTLARR